MISTCVLITMNMCRALRSSIVPFLLDCLQAAVGVGWLFGMAPFISVLCLWIDCIACVERRMVADSPFFGLTHVQVRQ